ncbi:MAG: type II secretion system protein GspM [Gallionella sp.]|nr:type II secretion system protein GspM [Gallionella sp.]
MKEHLKKFIAKVDGMTLRERALIFAAAAFLLVSLINALFLDPLLVEQKRLSTQVVQQQEKMKEIQAQLNALLQAKQDDKNAPQRERIRKLREQIAQGDAYLKGKRDKLVPPEKMADLLRQVLARNGQLQVVELQTLPVTLFIESSADDKTAKAATLEKQIFKHGVQLTVRGSYADLTQYLTALEKLPARMFWGMAKLNVVKYPNAELTLTLYTLSMDKVWLQV